MLKKSTNFYDAKNIARSYYYLSNVLPKLLLHLYMQVNKDKADVLHKAIDEWQSQQLLTEEQAHQLKNTIVVRKFDWKQVTIYAFIIAVICSVLSIIVLLADKPLREIILRFTQITDLGISCILTIATLLVFYISKIRFEKYKETPFTNNSFLLFGAFLSLATISYWAKTLHVFQNNYAFIFLIAGVVYIILATYFKSQTIWVMSILMLAFTYGIFTVSNSNDINKELFLGMNFPFRYILFGILLLSFLYLIKKNKHTQSFFRIHYIVGLLFFFISLWLVTIFGNFGNYERWNEVKQFQFIFWDVLLLVITSIGMYIGLKRNDFIIGNISLIFFILNLITRYFEYFWIPLHKSIFFMILAFIFWFIGSRAEKLWNLRFLEE